MSAYVCNDDTFIALAIYASTRNGGSENADPRYIDGIANADDLHSASDQSRLATLYANILYAENVRSVSARYPEEKGLNSLPGNSVKSLAIKVTLRQCIGAEWKLTPVEVLKLCSGYEYQTCETDDWKQTVAIAIIESIRRAAIRQLPGYDEAQRDFDVSTRKHRKAA